MWVSIGMAGVQSRSKTLSREAADAREAVHNRVSTIIFKLSKDNLKNVQNIASEARIFFKENSVAWDNSGYRLVPLSRYAYLKRELERRENLFIDAVTGDLIGNYDQIKADYEREVKTGLAREVPFPTIEQIKANFRFEIYEQPIANPNDLRLRHVDPRTIETMKSTINDAIATRLDAANQEIVARLIRDVRTLHKNTDNPEGRLFDTLKLNIEETVAVLPSLNLRNDPEINRLIIRVKNELSSIDVELLRKDKKERALVAKQSAAVLQDLEKYGKTITPKPTMTATKVTKVAKAVASAVTTDVQSDFASIKF